MTGDFYGAPWPEINRGLPRNEDETKPNIAKFVVRLPAGIWFRNKVEIKQKKRELCRDAKFSFFGQDFSL